MTAPVLMVLVLDPPERLWAVLTHRAFHAAKKSPNFYRFVDTTLPGGAETLLDLEDMLRRQKLTYQLKGMRRGNRRPPPPSKTQLRLSQTGMQRRKHLGAG